MAANWVAACPPGRVLLAGMALSRSMDISVSHEQRPARVTTPSGWVWAA